MNGCWRFSVVALACGAAILLAADAAMAQKNDTRAQDEAALRKASKDYVAALAANNWKAVGEFWTDDGIYVNDDGQEQKVKELLERVSNSPGTPRPHMKLTPTKLRFLTTDSATEDGQSEITPAGASKPVKGRFSAVWVRQGGKWKLDSLRESQIVTAEAPGERLETLEPFVGSWSGQVENVSAQITAAWNAGKTFLRRELTMTSHGKVAVSAMQQIGWDPIREQPRSWAFDASGGYGEGFWSQEGTAWMVLAETVHPDGKISKATHIFKFPNRDTMVWRSVHVTNDGVDAPDFEMTLKRGEKTAKPPASTTSEKSGDKAPSEKPHAIAPAAASASGDAAKKSALLASDAWKHMEQEFDQWAAVQVIYTPKQLEQQKAKLRAEVRKMNAAELQKFITETDAKLKKLLGKDADEARAWLGQYLSMMADGYRQKFIGEVPNFSDLTSAQMDQEYQKLRAKILRQQNAQQQFDAARTQNVNAGLQAKAAQQRSSAAAAATSRVDGVSNANPFQGSHAIPQAEHGTGAPPQMNFFEYGGRIGYSLPF